MKIFCDLDGTLIDVSVRHYKVYEEVVGSLGGIAMAQDIYWNLKRDKTKWSELLPLSELSVDSERIFLDRFIERIEDPRYLATDTPFPGAVATVEKLGRMGTCYLVSLRRNRSNLMEELDNLDLARHFTEVLTGHSDNDGYDVKIALIRDRLGSEGGVMIGDTEADIVTGKELGLRTFAVTSGIRNERFLAALDPQYIVGGIEEVIDLV